MVLLEDQAVSVAVDAAVAEADQLNVAAGLFQERIGVAVEGGERGGLAADERDWQR